MFNVIKVGGWSYGEQLNSSHMNQINDDLPFALDGRAGGSYELSDTLVLDKATSGTVLQLEKDLEVNATAAITHVHGTSDAQFDADVAVDGNTSLGSGVATSVALDALTTATLRVRAPKGVVHGNESPGTHLYSFELHDLVYVHPSGAPSAGCIWKIDPATSVIDKNFTNICTELMSFRHLGGGSAVDVKDPAGTTLATIGPAGSGNLVQIDVARAPELAAAYVVVGKVWQP